VIVGPVAQIDLFVILLDGFLGKSGHSQSHAGKQHNEFLHVRKVVDKCIFITVKKSLKEY
jgi:hypothetical protein